MLPVCYPSSPSPTTGLPEAVAYALSSVSGLTRWVDYIPVKLVSGALGVNEQSTNVGGFTPMRLLGSAIGMAAWRDYIPVYVDNSATEAWVTSATGYIPYANSVGMASEPSYYLNLSAPSNVTIADGQARGTITSTYNAVITASMSPSRTTGVAPLYVNFDMTGTTSTGSTNPTHECFFATDFGDTGAGVWANGVQSSGLTSKNAGYGPVTGHVYETPGTYTVTMSVTDGVNTVTKTGTIVVQDPDVVYAGTATICISHSNNFIGAPSGATQVNTSGNTDMYAAWNTYKGSNKRILFCKADTWVASASIAMTGLSGVTLGGYGTGVAATFGSGTMVSVTPAIGVTPVFRPDGGSDIRVCNFRLACNATTVAIHCTTADDLQMTWFKVEVRGATCAFSLFPNLGLNTLFKHEQTCIYECLHDEVYGYASAPADTPRVTGATASNGSPCVFTSTGHPFQRFNTVRIVGTPPSGFSNGVNYYVSGSNLTANTFSLSSTFSSDTPVASSSTGTCDVVAQSLGGGQGLFVATTRGGIMGCHFDNCNNGEQTIRLPYTYTSHINNNYIARPNQTKNIVKIHSRHYDNIIGLAGPLVSGWSEKIVFSANHLSLRDGYSYGEAIPNNGQLATKVGDAAIIISHGSPSEGLNERVRNVIVENNFTQICLGQPHDISMGFISIGCPNVTVRNNIADNSLGDRTTSFLADYAYVNFHFGSVVSSTTDSTVGVRYYNNTLYSNIYNAERAQFVLVNGAVAGASQVDDVQVKNNLWYLPFHIGADLTTRDAILIQAGATPTNVVDSTNTDSVSGGDPKTASPNFAVQPPRDGHLEDWRPTTGYAVNQGATIPVLRDFNNVTRVGGTYDLGAVLP